MFAIKLLHTLRDALQPLNMSEEFALPSIAVVGAQSSGKSSMLDSIIQYDCLPKGHKLKTSCPLRIVCYQKDVEPYIQFSHKENYYTDFEQVKAEIERRTDELTGTADNIVNTEIVMSIYAPDLANLTLVDLPGLIEYTDEKQPKELPKQVDELVKGYVADKNCLILAVQPANVHIANSKALALAKQYDPDEERTM